MSKVFIEGMDMPKSCESCRFYDYSNSTCIALPIYDLRDFRVGSQRIINDEEVDSLCPLKEIK